MTRTRLHSPTRPRLCGPTSRDGRPHPMRVIRSKGDRRGRVGFLAPLVWSAIAATCATAYALDGISSWIIGVAVFGAMALGEWLMVLTRPRDDALRFAAKRRRTT
jgi:hypothetical protein